MSDLASTKTSKPNRRWIGFAVVLLIVGAVAWYFYVPVPDYLPVEPTWTKSNAITWRSIAWKTNRYFEFRSDQSIEQLLPAIRTRLDAAGPWKSAYEQDDKQIVEQIIKSEENENWRELLKTDPEFLGERLANSAAPAIGRSRGRRLYKGPFVLVGRWRMDDEFTHRSIHVRLSPSSGGGTSIDIWDLFEYDH